MEKLVRLKPYKDYRGIPPKGYPTWAAYWAAKTVQDRVGGLR